MPMHALDNSTLLLFFLLNKLTVRDNVRARTVLLLHPWTDRRLIFRPRANALLVLPDTTVSTVT